MTHAPRDFWSCGRADCGPPQRPRTSLTSSSSTVVEALPEQHFQQEHLPGALSVPYDSPRERIDAALPDKDAAVVTYCASLTCPDSAQLAKGLTDLGYTNVRDYEEGKAGWLEAGLPVERGAAAPASA